jgi:hypothetical protein
MGERGTVRLGPALRSSMSTSALVSAAVATEPPPKQVAGSRGYRIHGVEVEPSRSYQTAHPDRRVGTRPSAADGGAPLSALTPARHAP